MEADRVPGGPGGEGRPSAQEGPSPRAAPLRGDLAAALVIAAVTVGVELGAYGLVRQESTPLEGLIAALGASAVWVALACGACCAGGRTAWGRLFRGGAVIDGSGVALAVLWAMRPAGAGGAQLLTLPAAAKAYCVLAAMGSFSMAAVFTARQLSGRRWAAVLSAMLLLAAAASPFWSAGVLRAAGDDVGLTLSGLLVDVNPFYGLTAAVVKETGFIWHSWGIMYEQITPLGSYPPPPLRWYTSAMWFGALAAALAVIAAWRAR